MSAGVAGSSAQRYPAAPANVIFTFPVLAPGPSPAVTVSVQRTPSGAAVTVIVPSPVPEAGEKYERRIGTRSTPRSVGGHRDDGSVPAGRIEAQVGGSERKRHFGRSRSAGHGDRLARGLARRRRARPTSNGSALGHVPHVEHPVTGTRDGFHPDGSRLGRPRKPATRCWRSHGPHCSPESFRRR